MNYTIYRRPAPLLLVLGLLLTTTGHTAADFDALHQEVAMRLAVFETQVARAEEAGIDVARERVTITTASLFLTYARWDSDHEAELAAAIGSWWVVKDRAGEIARQLPERQLREVLHMLETAEQELALVTARRDARRPAAPYDPTDLTLTGGYFRHRGRPVFPSSFVWMPDDPAINRAYGTIGGTFMHPPNLRQDGSVQIQYRPGSADEPMGYVFFGHKNLPGWALEQYPDIRVGERHFTAYDIDHPGTRRIWRDLLAAAVPQFSGRPVRQAGYLLANEPHWFSGTDEWATGPVSDHTFEKLRAWLETRHKEIDTLNQLWGTSFADFDQVALAVPVDLALIGTPIWYDWCRFNMARVSEWFAFLKNEIRHHDPDGATHIKLIPGHFAGGSRTHGLDFEQLVHLQDIIGADAKVTNSPDWRGDKPWTARYACFWRNLSMPYDFFRSIGPDKLIFDSEFHGLSTVHWRDPDMSPEYVRAIYWLAHLHGMGMNQTWYWSRNDDGSPKSQSISGFHASNLTLPRAMDAYGRVMVEVNAFAPEIATLATQPRPVRLFYSEPSAIQDGAYLDRLYNAYEALYHDGLPLGFATGQLLNQASAAALDDWPVVVATEPTFATADERAALDRYVQHGGTLLVMGAEALAKDEYGRPVSTPLPADGLVIRTAMGDFEALSKDVTNALKGVGIAPGVAISETNGVGPPGCVWRTAPWPGGELLSIINLGKSRATIQVDTGAPVHDLIANKEQPAVFAMQPFDVKLLLVGDGPPGTGVEETGLGATDAALPQAVSVAPAYPNPFNGNTVFEYTVHRPGHVAVDIHNIQGQIVRRLIDEHHNPGPYRLLWDGLDRDGHTVSAGVYLSRVTAEPDEPIRSIRHWVGKMLVLK
ncbi:MAG: hypothetical protein GKR89_00100 [Candidatus Latescibacteria bacterium]|nr:hypothetical protein [Candidatus Latescibacterota bacterium]